MTKTAKAETAARQILVWARQHNGRVVTRDTVDAILSRDADMPWGDANVRSVRTQVRRLALPDADVIRF